MSPCQGVDVRAGSHGFKRGRKGAEGIGPNHSERQFGCIGVHNLLCLLAVVDVVVVAET